MLPVGKLGNAWGTERVSKLTDDEQHTLMNLWTIFRSPLFVGANLPESAALITPLLTNKEVIDVDQHSSDNHPVIKTPTTVVWLAKAETGGGHYLAVFNIGDTEQTVSYAWKDLELKGSSYKVRDLWQHKDLGECEFIECAIEAARFGDVQAHRVVWSSKRWAERISRSAHLYLRFPKPPIKARK